MNNRVIGRIREAISKQAEELDLTGLELTDEEFSNLLPDIRLLTNLNSLLLSNNKLLMLPGIGQLTSLRTLSVSGNELTNLPQDISGLTSLQNLSLERNLFTSLPAVICNLTTLQVLKFGGNRLTSLPPEIGQLSILQFLDLTANALTALPPDIGRLTEMRGLYLLGNKLTELPFEIGKLIQLQQLTLDANRLKSLHHEIGQLGALRDLTLDANQLEELPSEIGHLSSLQQLTLVNNHLRALPAEIGKLTDLKKLFLYGNRLTDLPPEIGCLTALQEVTLSKNQLTDLPPEFCNLISMQRLLLDGNSLPRTYFDALNNGIPELLTLVGSLANDTDNGRVAEAKLLLTGEGEVGKTWLVKALRGEKNEALAPKQSTFGVELGRLDLGTPFTTATLAKSIAKPLEKISLNTWDFGGQKVYRILHQFFFSGDAVYLLVWKPRMGEEQCDLRGWLQRIHLVAKDSAKVILVATHAGDPTQRYNPVNILRDVEPHLRALVVDQIEVDSQTGHNIDVLKSLIAKHAVGLPRMGDPFPTQWQKLIDGLAVEKARQPTLEWDEFHRRCTVGGLSTDEMHLLAEVFIHQLGRALYFGDRKRRGELAAHLSDLIVLDPEWLSKAIVRVLEDDKLVADGGLLAHDRLTTIWADKPGFPRYPVTRHRFLVGLMEQLDVSFTVRSQKGAMSLIAERLPERRPDLPWYLESPAPADGLEELSVVAELDQEAPGLMSWIIAESSAYQVDACDNAEPGRTLSWLDGVFLDNPAQGAQAVFALTRQRDDKHRLSLAVRAYRPLPFFHELLGLTRRTLGRWKGLRARFYVPCPETGKDGHRCSGKFYFDTLKNLPNNIEQDRCDGPAPHFLPIQKLLYGLDALALHLPALGPENTSLIAQQIEAEVGAQVGNQLTEIRDDVRRLSHSALNYLRTLWQSHQAIHAPCPRLFTLDICGGEGNWWERAKRAAAPISGDKYALQLYCEQSYKPVGDPYYFSVPPEWMIKAAPLVRMMLPVLGVLQMGVEHEMARKIEGAQEFMKGLVEKVESADMRPVLRLGREPFWASDADYRILQNLLVTLDPTQAYRGMLQRQSPSGFILWMSSEQAAFHTPTPAIFLHSPPFKEVDRN